MPLKSNSKLFARYSSEVVYFERISKLILGTHCIFHDIFHALFNMPATALVIVVAV